MRVIDSHTEGEPTRVIVDGGPRSRATARSPNGGADLRPSSIICAASPLTEPRGHDAMVGALSVQAGRPLLRRRRHLLQQCRLSRHVRPRNDRRLRSRSPIWGGLRPDGIASIRRSESSASTLSIPQSATIENVESYRHSRGVEVERLRFGDRARRRRLGRQLVLPDRGRARGATLANVGELTAAASAIRAAIGAKGVTGKDGAEIDHIEMFGPPRSSGADSRNFVLCPGGAFDRSPCGTGTSAKLACLAADGKLRPGEVWVQESVIGSRFRATFEPGPNGGALPRISGRAYVCAEATLLQDPADPFRHGFASN